MTDDKPYVGRGGLKLRHALDAFEVDARGLRCADFGAAVGGFTDCLLRAGAESVIAIDTAYGVLDYRLRTDPRVRVKERTNALHADPPDESALCDLIAIDLGWTPQHLAVPAALRWLRAAEEARIITLVKPHYEAKRLGMESSLQSGVLNEADATRVLGEVLKEMPERGALPLAVARSPIAGGGSRRKRQGNVEYLALLRRG